MRDFLFGFLPTLFGFLLALLLLCPAHAADYRLVDRSGNVIMAITHGTTIDLHDLIDRNYLAVEASFDGVDHASWVEFTLIHSERHFDYKRTDRTSQAGWWQVCGGGCYPLRRVGSVMLKATVYFSDGQPSPAVGILKTDSVTFRITDGKPTIKPTNSGQPTCHGDPDSCKDSVGNGPLWAALSSLCASRPGAEISLGNGSTMRCP